MDRNLVTECAKAGEGRCEFIADAETELSMNTKIIKALKFATTPMINQVAVNWGGA